MVWWKSTYRAGAKCERCGADIARRKAPARFCLPCVERHQIDTGASAARKAVTAAVAAGTLPKASTQRCVDCGKPARDYDHRDYNKPLDVVPVCRSCNKLRGAAIPLISEVAED